MAGYRSLKGTPWEGGTRVAAFVSGVGVTESGSVDDQWLSAMDVMPTILELTDAAHPSQTSDAPPMTGRSFAPLMKGNAMDADIASLPIPFEFNTNRWIVQGDWKAVWPVDLQRWQLYNLEEDPAEQTDRSSDQPARLTAMVDAWEDWAEEIQIVGSMVETTPP
jgi:arylsulfatase